MRGHFDSITVTLTGGDKDAPGVGLFPLLYNSVHHIWYSGACEIDWLLDHLAMITDQIQCQ